MSQVTQKTQQHENQDRHNNTSHAPNPVQNAVEDVVEQLRQLRAEVERQHALLAHVLQDHGRQQAEIDALRAQVAMSVATERTEGIIADPLSEASTTRDDGLTPHVGGGHGTSRRSLLKWGGAAAAAATVALVASEGQSAHAASANNNDSLLIGNANTGTLSTSLAISGSSSASPFFEVDASGSTDGAANAIYGVCNAAFGIGIKGQNDSSTGTGMYGFSSSGFGVVGGSDSWIGVMGQSGTGIDVWANGTGRIRQFARASAGAPSSGTYSKGEQVRDKNGELWLCIADGAPGQWVRAAHAVYGYTGGAISYLSKPIRMLDTRSGASDAFVNGGGPYLGGSTHTLTIAGITFNSVTVPSSAIGAIGKVTAVSTAAGGGYIALVPHGVGFTGTANLPYGPSQTVATSFNVGLSAGQLDIIIGGNPTDVVIDLFGVVA